LQLTTRHWNKRRLAWHLPSCSDRGATEVYPTEDGRKLSPTRSRLRNQCWLFVSSCRHCFIHARCLPMPTLHWSVEFCPLPRVLSLQGTFYDIAESHNRCCMMRDTEPLFRSSVLGLYPVYFADFVAGMATNLAANIPFVLTKMNLGP
jgi:hypothetical protein